MEYGVTSHVMSVGRLVVKMIKRIDEGSVVKLSGVSDNIRVLTLPIRMISMSVFTYKSMSKPVRTNIGGATARGFDAILNECLTSG